MPRLPPAPHRIACARILAEVWPRKAVAAALEITIGHLGSAWGVCGTPSPQRRLTDRLLATGAEVAEVARILGVSRQAVYQTRSAEAPAAPARDPARACARILAELWPRQKVAAALGVPFGQLAAWGIQAEPTPEKRLRARLLATGAPPREVSQMLRLGTEALQAAEAR